MIQKLVQSVRQGKQNKVGEKAKIRKRYNQVQHLTKDTTFESIKNTINITNKSQEVIPSYNKKVRNDVNLVLLT